MSPITFRLRPHTLNQALGWLLLCVTVPLLVGALALVMVQEKHQRQLAQHQLSTLAQTLAHAVERELDYGKAQLEAIAASRLVDEGKLQELHQFCGQIDDQRPGSLIVLVGPDGQQLFNSAMPWGERHPNLWKLGEQQQEVQWQGRTLPLSSQNLTRKVFATGNVAYSDLYYGLLAKQPTLSLSVPVIRNGRVLYALTMAFPPALLEDLIRSSVSAPGIRAQVVDRRGVVVASNAASAFSLGERLSSAAVQTASSAGHFEGTDRDGLLVRGAYATSTNNGFLIQVSVPRDSEIGAVPSSSAGWIALVVAALAGSIFLAGMLGRRIARPLRELGHAARNGQPPPEGGSSGIDEIDVLAQALRAGAKAEQQRREQLVENAKQAEAEAALRRADRQKDEFLATLAHELRNPLAPICTAVELICRNDSGDPQAQRARQIIRRQVTHLSRLVDDLVDLSRLTVGKIDLRMETLDLCAVAAGAAESVYPALEAAGLKLEQRIEQPAVTVHADAVRLTQCIVNLINNAVKFTPRAGRIMLRVAREGEVASIEVSDTGIGISPHNLERVFELFVQEQPSGFGNSGLGIGLALTRRLVTLHGGTVQAESAGSGQGSRFCIKLPIANTSVQDRLSHPPMNAAYAAGASVLVVDDNRDAADVLSEMLDISGFGSRAVYDGEAALQAIEKGPPDAVLLDIGLPGIDGYEVCRRIRSSSIAKQPVVIALTGWGHEADKARASAAGFDAHLTKPAEPDRIIATLEGLLRRGKPDGVRDGNPLSLMRQCRMSAVGHNLLH